MITKGDIVEIDYLTNTCEVRIPIFETPAKAQEKVIMTATIILPPGVSNGYVAGDKVYVGFVDNSMSSPTVLGLLYPGSTELHDNLLKKNNRIIYNYTNDIYFINDSDSKGEAKKLSTELQKIKQELDQLKRKIDK